MKVLLTLALLAVIYQAVPKQADKPNTNQDDGKQLSTQSPQSTKGIGLSRPSSTEKQGSTDNESKQPTWCERIVSPVVSNWPLIAVAIWGILVARSTLNAIRWQAEETAKATQAMRDSLPLQKSSADAALLNAKAVINAERPWMFIEINHVGGAGQMFEMIFTNQGRTPAEVVGFEMELECRKSTDDFQSPAQYANEGAVMVSTRLIAPGKPFTPPGEPTINLPDNFIPEQWADIRSSRRRAVCWGRLLYRDLIEVPATIHVAGKDYGTLHETCFCYFWSPALNEFLITGPLGYNKHT